MNIKRRLYKIIVAGMELFFAVLLCLFGNALGGFWIAFVLSLVLIIPAILILKSLPADTREYESLLQETNSIYIELFCVHREGLSIGNETCNVYVRNDDIMVQSKNKEFFLPYYKIYNCIVTNQKAPNKQYITITYYDKDSNLTRLAFEELQFNQLKKLGEKINERIPKQEQILEEIQKIEL